MAYLLLALAQIAGIAMIPFGLPGLWIQLGALTIFAWATGFATVGAVPIAIVAFLAITAEITELLLAGRFARRYGGGRRAAFGAVIGAAAGALLGVPVPLLGSVLGAMCGAFFGAALMELIARRATLPALRAGWGALLGWTVASALKGGLAVVIAVFVLVVAYR